MKKVLLILGVMCFSLIAVHISTAEIDFETAVGIWLFDEGKGGVAGDISGQGNDGELVKSPSWVKGKFGSALEFDGKASCVQTGQKLLDNLEEIHHSYMGTDHGHSCEQDRTRRTERFS